jgi:Flp pilus assembly protein TadG
MKEPETVANRKAFQRSRPGYRARDEAGQAVILTVLAMSVVLGMVGLVIDLGRAYHVQRKLQGAADAAALAGASQLPDPSKSANLARDYGASAAGKNKVSNLASITETISAKCVTTFGGCYPTNAITVTEKASVKTAFLGMLGVGNLDINVRSTACGPCATRPADVMLIFDRTLSMCMDIDGNWDGNCTKLTNARSGMLTLVGSLDPALDRIGLAVLPPATSVGAACSTPPFDIYDSKSAAWMLVPLSNDYVVNGKLNNSSKLVSTIKCLPPQGPTAYADAIDKAQAELSANGRSNADHYIVFFTDGAANTGPAYYPKSSPYRNQPCHQGVTSANAAKAKGSIVFAIGYVLDAFDGGANRCQAQSYEGPDEQPRITAYSALSQIASRADTFYNQPAPGSLNALFAHVATKISGPRLISDTTP